MPKLRLKVVEKIPLILIPIPNAEVTAYVSHPEWGEEPYYGWTDKDGVWELDTGSNVYVYWRIEKEGYEDETGDVMLYASDIEVIERLTNKSLSDFENKIGIPIGVLILVAIVLAVVLVLILA